jgi:hypothetical protein
LNPHVKTNMDWHAEDTALINSLISTVPNGQNANDAIVSHETIPHTEHRQLETALVNGTKMLTSNILNMSCQYISNTNVNILSIMTDNSTVQICTLNEQIIKHTVKMHYVWTIFFTNYRTQYEQYFGIHYTALCLNTWYCTVSEGFPL